MPIRCTRRALAVVALLFAVRPTPLWAVPARIVLAQSVENTYVVQQGDTISGIARKFGLQKDAIVRVNDLAHPDRLAAGYVLRLPVTEAPTPPDAVRPTAVAATATEMSQVVPTTPPVKPRAAAEADPADAPRSASAPKAAALPAPAPETSGKANAAPAGPEAQLQSAAVTPPPGHAAPLPPGNSTTPVAHVDIDQLAVGVYKHPGLGMLRLSQREGGLTLAKDNLNIPMRHLLYGVYDGTDSSGNILNIQLVFDAAGHVEALRYSTAGTGQVTFDKIKK